MIEPIQKNLNASQATPPREVLASSPARSGLTGRLADSAIFQNVRNAVEDVASTGGRWFSQPLLELQSVVQNLSQFFGIAILRAMSQRAERKREETEEETREQALLVQRLQGQRVLMQAQEKRREADEHR